MSESENPLTQAALDALIDGEYVVEHEDSNRNKSKMLGPADLLKMRELEIKLTNDESRATNGIYRNMW